MGNLMGVITALGSLMSIVGPLWGGLAVDLIEPGAPFLIASVLFAVALVLLIASDRQAHRGTTALLCADAQVEDIAEQPDGEI